MVALDMFIDSVLEGLQIAGLNKKNSKQIAKYCSVSAVIGSLRYGECAVISSHNITITIFISTDSLGCGYLHSVCVVV